MISTTLFFTGASLVLPLPFLDPLLRWVLMHFPNSFGVGNFKRSARHYVIGYCHEMSICVLWKSFMCKLCNYAMNSSEGFSKCCVFPAVVLYIVHKQLFILQFYFKQVDVQLGFVNLMKVMFHFKNYFSTISAMIPFLRQKFLLQE